MEPSVHKVRVRHYVEWLWWQIFRAFICAYARVGFNSAFWATKFNKCSSMVHIAIYWTGSCSGKALDLYSVLISSYYGRTPVILIEGFRGFHRHLQENPGKVLRLWQELFLRNPFQFITHPPSYQSRYNLRYLHYKKPQKQNTEQT